METVMSRDKKKPRFVIVAKMPMDFPQMRQRQLGAPPSFSQLSSIVNYSWFWSKGGGAIKDVA